MIISKYLTTILTNFFITAAISYVANMFSWWDSKSEDTDIDPPEINPQPAPQPQPQLQPTNQENKEGEDKDLLFLCPITLEVMKDPVITPHGICFEREV